MPTGEPSKPICRAPGEGEPLPLFHLKSPISITSTISPPYNPCQRATVSNALEHEEKIKSTERERDGGVDEPHSSAVVDLHFVCFMCRPEGTRRW